LQQFNGQNIANIIWSAATLQDVFPKLLTTLQIQLKERFAELLELVRALAQAIPRVAKTLKAQECANIIGRLGL